MSLALGLDFGTSGARGIVIDLPGTPLIEVDYPFHGLDPGSPTVWKTALLSLLQQIPLKFRHHLTRIAIDGTSSTVLLCNQEGEPLVSPLLYNQGCGVTLLPEIEAFAPENHPVLSATSSLAKLLWWQQQGEIPPDSSVYLLHQADWLSFLLQGHLAITDYHNALKLGYDVEAFCYPDWLMAALDSRILSKKFHLPQVVAPGTVIQTITPEIAQDFQLPPQCVVCAGTTDSIAAFLASLATRPGEAVTSLGSTLVIKLLSQRRVDQAQYGIYSHRLGNLWLTGGASNTGGAVLRHFFTDQELTQLSLLIDPQQQSPYRYYPLLKPGERFPIHNPTLEPQLTPRSDNPVEFLHGLLESIAHIEAQGYGLLQTLGATPLQQVYTAGGGAQNPIWTEIRARCLGVPVISSQYQAAAYGAGILALRGIAQYQSFEIGL